MGKIEFPAPHVYYRIRSADLAWYLELSDVNDEKIVMRPLKETLDQQWTFVASTAGDGTFKILNAATENLRSPRFLGFLDKDMSRTPPTLLDPNQGDVLGLTDADTPQHWKVSNTEGDLYTLTCKSLKRTFEVFLETKDTGKAGLLETKVMNDVRIPPTRKWSVLEVNPSVPKDTYRIRTLTGTVITTKPGTNTVTVEALAKGSQQEWEVEPMGNGKCTIKNIAEKSFLAWEQGKNGFAQISKTPLPQVWTVRSLGEYTHGISMSYMMPDKTKITLALSNGQGNAELKPKKVSFNQIWLFEAVDASKEDVVDPPPQYEPTTRYPEITARPYFIQNVGTSNYVFIASSPWRLYPGGRSYNFSLDYIGNSSEFTLRYSTNYYFDVSGDVLITTNQPTTKWVLDRDTDPQGNKCYYICLSTNPSMVLTGDTRNDVNGYPLYILATKRNGFTRHQWYFSA
ncbi:hypothetical protein GYMLUDRAFT_37970 [Collybiopsis luxurians FD-317 M1]|nr:hypothetical protein GYMLUDRAFT_37970 [Collybiopsis luxurians FD-317 M1]